MSLSETRTGSSSSESSIIPSISIVIPTRNRLAMLQQAVESVLAQSVQDLELVVVDDASEDGTPEWLRSVPDPRLRVVCMAHHAEQSATRNTGVRAARAPVTLSFDDDDLLPRRALETHLEALQDHPEAIASIGGFTAFDERGSEQVHRVVRRTETRVIWRDVLFGWIAVAGQCAFRTEALANVGWWDESFIRATDHELWSRLSRHGPVVLLSETVLTYRVHGGQWRPTALDALMTDARRRAVEQLDGVERSQGERILEARTLAQEAEHHFLEAEAGPALRRYGRVLVEMPGLLWSPLTRPMILRPMTRCLAGSWGIRAGRRGLSTLNRWRGRELDFSVRSTVESDGRVPSAPPPPSAAHEVRGETPPSAPIAASAPTASSDLKRRLLKVRLEQRGHRRADRSGIPRRDLAQPVPLSFGQEGLWFIEHLHPGRAVYDIPCTVRLQGELDADALRRALTEIVARHEVLRTVVEVDAEGRPWQRYEEPTDLELPIHDLTPLAEVERDGALRAQVDAALRQPFDLSRESLFRAALFKLAATTHVLLLRVHHLVCDGWSMGVFTRELGAVYGACRAGEVPSLPTLPIQYGDYAVWERGALQGARLWNHLDFWRGQLGGDPPALELPSDMPRPTTPSVRGAHAPIEFGAELSGEVRALAARHGVTPFHTLLAAFNVFVYDVTRQEDIVVGTTYANRAHTDVEGLIGYFVNMLPFRTNLAGNPRFSAIQREVRDTALAIAAHQELPLAKLVTELHPDRDLAQHPYFQVVFYYLTPDHNPAVYGFGISSVEHTIDVAGLRLTPFDIECGLARFDMAVLVWDLPEGLHGVIEYSTDLFTPATIGRWSERLVSVLRAAVANPDAARDELVACSERDEQRRLDARTVALRTAARRRLADLQPR